MSYKTRNNTFGSNNDSLLINDKSISDNINDLIQENISQDAIVNATLQNYSTKSYANGLITTLKNSSNIYKVVNNNYTVLQDNITEHSVINKSQHQLRLTDKNTALSKESGLSFICNSDNETSTIAGYANLINTGILQLTTWSDKNVMMQIKNDKLEFLTGGNNLTIDKINGITFDGGIPKITDNSNLTDNNQIVKKKNLDDRFINFLSSANIYTNLNTFNTIPQISSILNPSNDNDILKKKNLDDRFTTFLNTDNSFSGLNTFQTNSNSNHISLNVNTRHSNNYDLVGCRNISINDINLTTNKSTNLSIYCNSDNQTSYLLGSHSDGVSSGKLSIGIWGNNANGLYIQNGHTKIIGSNNSMTIDSNGIIFEGSTPKLNVYSIPEDDLMLVSKKYLIEYLKDQTLISSTGKTLNYREEATINTPAITSISGRSYLYGLYPIDFGTNINNNTTSYFRSFYLNTYQTFTEFKTCILEVYRNIENHTKVSPTNHFIINNNGSVLNTMTDYGVKRTSPFLDSEWKTGGVKNISLSQFHIQSYQNFTPNITQLSSSKSLWSAGASVEQTYNFDIFSGVSKTSKHVGIAFYYFPSSNLLTTPHRLKVDLGFPNMLNNPTNNNWINAIEINSSISTGFDATGKNGWFLTQN